MDNYEFKEGYDTFTLDKFEFGYGRVLENLPVEYVLRGNPKYDGEGRIANAIVYCHGFNGNSGSLDNLFKLMQEDHIFDKNEYCFISITSFGFPESCSPSTTDLKHNFPKYSIKDSVNFRRQFLKERLGIERVHGIIAQGFGGYEAFTWACEYPDEMDFMIIFSSSYKTNGYRYVLSKCMDSIIESSDEFYEGIYSESLSKTMVSINSLLYSNHFSKKAFQQLSNDEIDVLMEDFVDNGLFIDIYDFKFRNDAVLNYNVEDKLPDIKVKTLVVSSNDDIYYSPEFDMIPLKDKIKNCRMILFDSQLSYDYLEDYEMFEEDLSKFINELYYEFKK